MKEDGNSDDSFQAVYTANRHKWVVLYKYAILMWTCKGTILYFRPLSPILVNQGAGTDLEASVNVGI